MKQDVLEAISLQGLRDLIEISAPDRLLDSGSRKVLLRAAQAALRGIRPDSSLEEVEHLASELKEAGVLEEEVLRRKIQGRLRVASVEGNIGRAAWREIYIEVKQDLPQDAVEFDLVALFYDTRRQLGVTVVEPESRPKPEPVVVPTALTEPNPSIEVKPVPTRPPAPPEPMPVEIPGMLGQPNQKTSLHPAIQVLLVSLAIGALVYFVLLYVAPG